MDTKMWKWKWDEENAKYNIARSMFIDCINDFPNWKSNKLAYEQVELDLS